MLLNRRVPITFIFTKIKTDIFAIIVYSTTVGFLKQHFIDQGITIPLQIIAILGTAISLLLTFRTGQAYDRWWEARQIWGSIVNHSRSLIRQLQSFYVYEDKAELLKNSVNRQIAWCYELGEGLRGEDQQATLEQYFETETIEELKKNQNIPNAILTLHSSELKSALEKGAINQFQQIQIDSTISSLTDCMGMCERIKRTVFPKTYSMLLHYLIYVFATLFPFALLNHSLYVEIGLNIIITSIFFMIERTAIYIQDPFDGRPTDTPVTMISRIIEIDLKQMIKSPNIPEPLKDKGYYIM